ncbi:MAG: hypothetical protein JO222_12450 [Frankiales bacterium]|nr:hypothetical protein [Frankiales bacterium]
MRVVIADSATNEGRRLADAIDRLLPTADVLLYLEPDDAVRGISEHRPDVVFVAPRVEPLDGADLIRQIVAIESLDATIVGLVDKPDPDASHRLIDAGAGVVAERPVDVLTLRTAFRQRAQGIPG